MFFVNIAVRCALLPLRNPRARVLTVLADGLSMLMMASHRWAHTHPEHTPLLVGLAQRVGLLLSQTQHSYHHAGFVSHFSIFTVRYEASLIITLVMILITVYSIL